MTEEDKIKKFKYILRLSGVEAVNTITHIFKRFKKYNFALF